MGSTYNRLFVFEKQYDKKDGMCVYCIENLVNGKCYVGITSGFLYLRAGRHFSDLRGGYHANPYLQASYDKYGEENFKVSMLYYTDTVDNLAILESFYCALLRTNEKEFGFNLKEPGFIKQNSLANYKFNNPVIRYPEERRKAYSERMKNNPNGWITISEEGKRRISEKAKERFKLKGNHLLGASKTPQAIEKRRLSVIGVLAGAKNPASRAVAVYDIDDQRQYIFPTVIEAAEYFGINKCTIARINRFEPTNTGLRFMKL